MRVRASQGPMNRWSSAAIDASAPQVRKIFGYIDFEREGRCSNDSRRYSNANRSFAMTLETIRGLRRTGDDRWHFDIHDQLIEATLNGAKGVGLVSNVCGPYQGWVYKSTME